MCLVENDWIVKKATLICVILKPNRQLCFTPTTTFAGKRTVRFSCILKQVAVFLKFIHIPILFISSLATDERTVVSLSIRK